MDTTTTPRPDAAQATLRKRHIARAINSIARTSRREIAEMVGFRSVWGWDNCREREANPIF
jgi:hypothetical protein